MKIEESLKELKIAVENVLLAARTDNITTLKNALALKEYSEQFGEQLGVVIFGDLNEFKNLNTNYGHEAGDAAIKAIGDMIQEKIVENLDAVGFRLGGDEFLILLAQEKLEAFNLIAPSFAKCEFDYDEKRLAAKMSFGYTVSDPKSKIDFDTLRRRAEEACHEAKLGDGKVVEWSHDLESTQFHSIRGRRCFSCNSKIDCKIPKALEITELINCPVCRKPL